MQLPLYQHENAVDPSVHLRGGLQPEFPVHAGVEDILAGEDSELESALRLLARER